MGLKDIAIFVGMGVIVVIMLIMTKSGKQKPFNKVTNGIVIVGIIIALGFYIAGLFSE